jgi:NitT/TauT family transport system substrate-binding protein
MPDPTPPPWTRRRLLQLGVAASAASLLGVTGCGRREPLVVAVQSWCGFQFIRLAQRRGWLGDAAVQLLDVASSDAATAGLRDGTVDAATLTLDECVRLRATGVDVQTVLVCDVSAGADVLLVRPEVANLDDLRGRRVGVESTALGALVFSEVLREAGLQRADVTVVDIEEDHFEAWQRGGLDAVLTYGVSAELLGARGLEPLIDSRDLKQVIFDVLAVRTDVAHAHRRALRAVVAGHFRGLELWQRNRIDASYELALLLETPPEEVASLYKGIDLPDVAYNRHALAPPALELTATAQDIAVALRDAGLMQSVPSARGLFAADYLPSAA